MPAQRSVLHGAIRSLQTISLYLEVCFDVPDPSGLRVPRSLLRMQFSTSILALQTLLAFLLFSSTSYAGTTAGEAPPNNCLPAPAPLPVPPNSHPSQPRDLELHLRAEHRLQRRNDLYTQALPPPNLSARGNGICYLPKAQYPGSNSFIGWNQDSVSMILPAGTYALKWLLSNPDIPPNG